MKKYTYSQARQRLSEVLDTALTEEVLITRRRGEMFLVMRKTSAQSPFDVPAIQTKATTRDILNAIQESRKRAR